MQILLEALFVALYTVILFQIISLFINNKYLLLYALGFCKHFLSYYLYIHDLYCNSGYACKKILHNHNDNNNNNNNNKIIYKSQNKFLLIESLLEGLWFLLAGSILTSLIKKTKWFGVIFVLGFVTHLLSEIIHIHDYFCSYNCKVFRN
jgi:hypothetical protein